MFDMLRMYLQTMIEHVFSNFTSLKSRIVLQVARKIAPCDRAFTNENLLHCFQH